MYNTLGTPGKIVNPMVPIRHRNKLAHDWSVGVPSIFKCYPPEAVRILRYMCFEAIKDY